MSIAIAELKLNQNDDTAYHKNSIPKYSDFGKSEQTLLAPSCLDIITTPFTGSTLFGIIRGPNCSFQLSLATSTKPTAEGLSKTVMVRFIMLFGLWSS